MTGTAVFARGSTQGKETWTARLARDGERAIACQSSAQQRITSELLESAVRAGAAAFVLTGSTALGRRTPVSDIDYYLVGPRIDVGCQDEEVDVFTVGEAAFLRHLEEGDDYLHWTLRFGLVLHDTGVLERAAAVVREEARWPSAARKMDQAARAVDMAEAIIASGDHDAGVEQCRVALSLGARWVLLRAGEFPRARSDLAGQLRHQGWEWLGQPLEAAIASDPTDQQMLVALARLKTALSG